MPPTSIIFQLITPIYVPLNKIIIQISNRFGKKMRNCSYSQKAFLESVQLYHFEKGTHVFEVHLVSVLFYVVSTSIKTLKKTWMDVAITTSWDARFLLKVSFSENTYTVKRRSIIHKLPKAEIYIYFLLQIHAYVNTKLSINCPTMQAFFLQCNLFDL